MIVGSSDLNFTKNKMLADESKQLAGEAKENSNNAMISANGKNTNYYGQIVPTGEKIIENDTWFAQDSSGVCIGIYQYKNKVWTKTKLDYNALTVNQLSALSADLGNVTAGNIAGVNLKLGNYNSSTGKYPFEADRNGFVYMSKLQIDSDSDTLEHGFKPKITIGDGQWRGYSRIKRTFDNMSEGMKDAYYDVITSIDNGHFRVRALNKKGTTSGNDNDFQNYESRSMYYSERGLSTSYGVFAGTSGQGTSRYIDFWPGENGFDNPSTSQRGMKIFSGVAMLIEGGGSGRSFDIISNDDLNISALKTLTLSDKSDYMTLSEIYKNGSGGGTLNSGKFLSAGGLVTNSSALFLGVDSNLHVTDMKGYNSGNGISYRPLKASFLFANALDNNPDVSGINVYVRPTNTGSLRVTTTGTTNEYRPVQAKSFDVSSSYTYKQDIKEMTRNALPILDELKIHEYRMKSDVEAGIEDDWKVGLIAEYSPQVVTDDGLKVDIYKMQSLHWKASQEMLQEIKGLRLSQEIQNKQIKELESLNQKQELMMLDLVRRIEELELIN